MVSKWCRISSTNPNTFWFFDQWHLSCPFDTFSIYWIIYEELKLICCSSIAFDIWAFSSFNLASKSPPFFCNFGLLYILGAPWLVRYSLPPTACEESEHGAPVLPFGLNLFHLSQREMGLIKATCYQIITATDTQCHQNIWENAIYTLESLWHSSIHHPLCNDRDLPVEPTILSSMAFTDIVSDCKLCSTWVSTSTGPKSIAKSSYIYTCVHSPSKPIRSDLQRAKRPPCLLNSKQLCTEARLPKCSIGRASRQNLSITAPSRFRLLAALHRYSKPMLGAYYY